MTTALYRSSSRRSGGKIDIIPEGVTHDRRPVKVLLVGEWNPDEFLRYLDASMQSAGIATDAELARLSGLRQQQPSSWRRGVRPSQGSLDKVAPALGVPAVNLYVMAGWRAPGEDNDVTIEIVPAEIRELIAFYNEPDRTEEQREVIRAHTKVAVSGFRAMFGSIKKAIKVTKSHKRAG